MRCRFRGDGRVARGRSSQPADGSEVEVTAQPESGLHVSPPAARSRGGSTRSRAGLWLSWILGAALLVAVVVGALHFSEGREFVHLAERAEPWWLAVAILLQAGTYWAQGEVFRSVGRATRFHLPLVTVWRLGFTKLFVDQALPSGGISGTVVLTRGLEQRGMPRPAVATAVVVDLASYYAAYVASLAAALVFAAVHGEASELVVLVSVVFGLFGIALSMTVLALSGREAPALRRRLSRLRSARTALEFLLEAEPKVARSPRLLLEASAYQLAIVLFDAATLWVLIRSLGAEVAPGGVFASFVISSLFRTIGIVPGGLGTFEATSIVTLKLVGVGVPAALAATLLFRGLTFWLPLLPGMWFSRRAGAS